ncbi:MAG: class I SAM-dependent methyltransferase [Polyangiaceae bacterium]|nr:class I SAM-dependent methyltransferase [Polyangiaceae bacterium]
MPSPVHLSGVPETMLWTLHNRASEAMRPRPILEDPEAIRIYRAISYDYRRSFGAPDGSHAIRSRVFDDAVRPWMEAHPGATVVELACGLETQFQRVDDGKIRWLCVDVPEAIAVRDRFLSPPDRCRHLACSALDLRWMDEVDPASPVFLTAQGLLMYLPEPEVQRLLQAICERFSGVEIMFDVIPRWFSRKTLQGFRKTRHYQAPPMPWGVNRDEIEPLLRRWCPRVDSVRLVPFGYFRGLQGLLFPLFARTPLQRLLPSVVHLRTKAP